LIAIKESVMASRSARLPDRFPVGTKLVIEGRRGGPVSRYLEFPDGTFCPLPARPAHPVNRKARAAKRRTARVVSRRA
jgi:hypothetical protein